MNTHRTLFMQDLGLHSSSEDQSSQNLCPQKHSGQVINIFKVPPRDGSEVGKEIFSAIYIYIYIYQTLCTSRQSLLQVSQY